MFIAVNYLAVLVAAIGGMAVGALWYGPVFGKKWKQLMGFTDESMRMMPLSPFQAMGLGFVSMLITSYVLAEFITFLGVGTLAGAWQLAFLIWLGFYFTTSAGAWLWEGKSYKLWLFNAAQFLIALGVISAILTLWQ